jgi:N-acetyl sugar amidotransferase
MGVAKSRAHESHQASNLLRQSCSRCILQTGDVDDISFDDHGVCNHCRSVDRQMARLPDTPSTRRHELSNLVSRIKQSGQGRRYNCIMGLSGGVDSSYLAFEAHRLGLRPLVVHFDNGWNSELAVANIESIVTRLELDLHTLVVDWEEFRDLQLAYFKASVIDIEVATDHAIYGTLYRMAVDHGVKFILSGNNVATEGILPAAWHFNKGDYINLLSIHRQFGTRPLKTYPILDRRLKTQAKRSGVEVVTPLDLMEYKLFDAKETISRELGWRDYGGKHHESVFTRFYQSSILPRKFGVNKRLAHLASLVTTGEMSRDEGLRLRDIRPVPEDVLRNDKKFVLKKLGLNDEQFEQLMALPIRSHKDFAVEGSFFEYFPVFKPLRPVWRRIRAA